MGRNRGAKKKHKGKLAWKNHKANRGRKPAKGKSKDFISWPEVRRKMLSRSTKLVQPAEPSAPTSD